MKRKFLRSALVLLGIFNFLNLALASPETRDSSPDFDLRHGSHFEPATQSADQTAAEIKLKARLPHARVDFDELTGTPKSISSKEGFLTGPAGQGKGVLATTAAKFDAKDTHRATRAFLEEYRNLFGFGADALEKSRIKRDFVTPHNGVRTTIWEQQINGVPVFNGILVSHVTRAGELINLSSQWVPNPKTASNSPALLSSPNIDASKAVSLLAQNIGDDAPGDSLKSKAPGEGAEKKQRFTSPKLKGEAEAKMVWLPVQSDKMRLCWDVVLMSRSQGKMFRGVIDVETGEVLIRHCLTVNLSEATYRVYTSDSPSPFSPGYPTPVTNQPSLASRQLVTFAAVDTNASPSGWISDTDNETLGNNVDAHLDQNGDDNPELPRPHGNPWHVFDFPLDLTKSPQSYSDASVVQLFYLCNFMHDRLYELGFTEEAGNFQNNNFGRGGIEGDALQADAQDGSGTDNANMSTPPDGMAPRMQMFLFTGPTPNRDGSLDAEIVLHEYTHGLSNRRVGGGVGLSTLQSGGMGEGWSDFYGLALLSSSQDDVDAVYAAGAYASYRLGGLTQNYYFGIRRYPYCTDTNKNPLTFKDIDPAQASEHTGVPRNPIIGNTANEVHNMGELWCMTLWEARANLIKKHGFETGNQLILQLVTDGMNLSPANPNFLQARDAIIQADMIDTGGANRNELWAAFAKRGMGLKASSPSSSTTSGVFENFDAPNDFVILPEVITLNGTPGGPFVNPTLILTNAGTNQITWNSSVSEHWLNLSTSSGILPSGAATTLTLNLDPITANFPAGSYESTLLFTNTGDGSIQSRTFQLRIAQPDYYTERFDGNAQLLRNQTFTFIPDGSASYYSVHREPATVFPTPPQPSTAIAITSASGQKLTLSGFNSISLYGINTNVFFVSSSGDITLTKLDASGDTSIANHFKVPRISAFVSNLSPEKGGTVYVQELSDRAVVTFENVPETNTGKANSFQTELFYDGRIRITYLEINSSTCLVGLSAGNGVPADFGDSDFLQYATTLPALTLTAPVTVKKGTGNMENACQILLPAPLSSNLTITLASSFPNSISVPPTIVIPAGMTNVRYPICVQDSQKLEGTRIVALTASATGYMTGISKIILTDSRTATLTLGAPSSVREGDGQFPVTLNLNETPTTPILVNLSSSDLTELLVPSFVIINPGESSVIFKATVVDDTEIDGLQNVTITAHVDNWIDAAANIAVLDNEATTLALTIPRCMTEGQGTQTNAGTVTIPGTLHTNLVVHLSASGSEKLTIPQQITIPAGKTFAKFDIAISDNQLVESTQAAYISASAPGFDDASALIKLYDDETPLVPVNISPADQAINVPAKSTKLTWSGGEGEQAVNGGFESPDLNGWIINVTGPMMVDVNDGFFPIIPWFAFVPPFEGHYCLVTEPLGPSHFEIYQDLAIPEGATSTILSWADLVWNFADDFGADQYFRVEVRNTKNELLEILYSTKPGDELMGSWTQRSFDLSRYMGMSIRIAFVQQVTPYYMNLFLDNVSLQLGTHSVPTHYTVYFGTNSDLGSEQLLGTTTNTSWDLPLLLPQTTYYWQIASKREGQALGPVSQFTTKGADHFDWGMIASPQYVDEPFPVNITAKDEFDRIVSNFYGPVALFSMTSPNSNPLWIEGFEDIDNFNWVSGSGTYIRAVTNQTAAVGTNSFTLIGGNGQHLDGISHSCPSLKPNRINFRIRTSSTSSAGGYFVLTDSATNILAFFCVHTGELGVYEDAGGWHGSSCQSNTWYKISFLLDWNRHQLDYYVDDSLVYSAIPFRNSGVSEIANVFLYNFDNVQAWWDQIEFLSGGSPQNIAITPANTTKFTNGVWSGQISVSSPAQELSIIAQDNQGHRGSASLSVFAHNDLSLTMSSDSLMGSIGQLLTYTLLVTNTGPAIAKNCSVIDTLPEEVTFVSATNTHGSANFMGDSVLCELGDLEPAGSALITLSVMPNNSGTITNRAIVMSDTPEIFQDNNCSEILTPIMPQISIANTTLREGNSGTYNSIFPVTLSGPFERTVQIDYSTADLTALAGTDYITTSGTLVFPAGTTSNTITVAVCGNTTIETDKTFAVNLANPINATIACAQGIGTITNDDGIPGELFKLSWNTVPSPQSLNRPFSVTVTAKDLADNLATNFTGNVALAAICNTPQTNAIGQDATSQSYPIYTFYHDERTQVIYLKSELAGGQRITSLTLDVSTAPGQMLNNWTIRMKHTSLSSYGNNAAWEGGGWTTVYQNNETINSSGLVTFQFSNPFDYNGNDNLMIDFSYNNSSYTSPSYCNATAVNSIRTLYYYTDSYYGDPLAWSGNYPYANSSSYIPNIKLGCLPLFNVQPPVSGNFTNGSWTGEIFVMGSGKGICLMADDRNGCVQTSNPFDVVITNDLALTMTGPTNVTVDQQITYTLSVTNQHSTNVASGVVISNVLPTTLSYVSATTPQGTVTNDGQKVIFYLGDLPAGSSATMTLCVQPTRTLTVINRACVSRTEPEEYLANNSAQITTAVIPTANIADITTVEGNLGKHSASFKLNLSSAFDQTSTIYYSTANGTAIATKDYQPISGTISIQPGLTSAIVSVPIIGNTQVEPTKTFYLNLSSPQNVKLIRTQAQANILNDDGAPGDIQSFTFNPISPQVPNRFSVTLTAKDNGGQTATNFNGKAALMASQGVYHSNVIGSASSTDSYPLGSSYGGIKQRTQVIYLTNELGGAGQITSFALNVEYGSATLSNWTIRVKHTPLSSYSSYQWESYGWTTVLRTNLKVATTGWIQMPLPTPFDYNGTNNLLVDFSFNGASGNSVYSFQTYRGSARTLYTQYYSGSDDPLNWSGTTPYPSYDYYTPDLVVVFGRSIPIQPTIIDHFTNGIWTGSVSVSDIGTNLYLSADDRNGHTGVSNPFEICPTDDIGVSAIISPDPAGLYQPLTYSFVVTNTGPSDATSVTVTNTLPDHISWVSATTSQGTWYWTNKTLIYNLGTIAGGSSAVVSFVVTPMAMVNLTNLVQIYRGEPDTYQPDNTLQTVTRVFSAATIHDVSLPEGNVGTTNFVFPITFSPPLTQQGSLNYSTANGTAVSGIDYLPTAGTLILPSGITSTSITVTVVGNTLIESNKNFFVNLSAPSNVSLTRTQAVGTILNDDGLPGDIYTLEWDHIDWQCSAQPFSVTLTARDISNNVASNFSGRVTLKARGSSCDTNIGSGSAQVNFPLGTYYPKQRSQIIYPANSLGFTGRIRALSFNVATIPSSPMTNWTIRVKHTPLTAYTYLNSNWETNGWTVVCNTNLSVNTTGWLTFQFASPFDYDGTNNLMIDFTYNNNSFYGSVFSSCFGTYQSQYRTLQYAGNFSGDPLNWSGTTPYGNLNSYTPNLRLTIEPLAPVLPANTGNFEAGIWTGSIAVQGNNPVVQLIADDQNGHTATSNPFNLVAANDTILSCSNLSGPVFLGSNFTYSINVLNSRSLYSVTGVKTISVLPKGLDFISAIPSQGTCTYEPISRKLTCNLDTLNPRTNATVLVNLNALLPGLVTNLVTLVQNESDGTIANNSSQLVTSIFGPTVAMFNNPTYVDTNLPASTSIAEQASLTSLCFPVVTFTNIISAAETNTILLFPETLKKYLAPDLLPSERQAITNFVSRGGKLIVNGSPNPRAAGLLNALFNFSIQEVSSSLTSMRTVVGASTIFSNAPSTLPGNTYVSVLAINTLPPGARTIYTNSQGSSVVQIGFGKGHIIFLGWNWYNSKPIGYQDGGWLSVLSSAVIAPSLPPLPPDNLNAVSGNHQIALTWSPSEAITYTVKRASSIEGPYDVIASVTDTKYTDTQLTNEITLFYVVSAINKVGEGLNSTIVTATPHGLPTLLNTLAGANPSLYLAWPNWATNYKLYTATNLNTPLWEPLTNTSISNGFYILSLPATNSQQFFRLSSP